MKKIIPDNELALIEKAEEDRFSALRMQLVDSHPFWGHLAMQLKLVAAPNMHGIAATDCINHIWFNPIFTRHIPISQLGFILCHEVCHIILASSERRIGRNPQRWNCATDYAINLLVAGIVRPGSWKKERLYQIPNVEVPDLGRVFPLLDPRFEGMTAESIYERLADRKLPETEDVSVSLSMPGSSSNSEDNVTLTGTTFKDCKIDIHLPSVLNEGQREKIVERILDAVQIWKKSDNKGNCPFSQIRDILPAEKSKTPWQEILKIYCGHALARDEFSHAHPNKRYLSENLFVPGLHSEKTDLIVVALDTSGSMDTAQLSSAFSEIRSIAAQCTVKLIVADSKILKVIEDPCIETFMSQEKTPGGGDTSHLPVFAYLEKNQLQPDLFIGITDLFSVFPEKVPPYPVLWLTPACHGEVPWGNILELHDYCDYESLDLNEDDELAPF